MLCKLWRWLFPKSVKPLPPVRKSRRLTNPPPGPQNPHQRVLSRMVHAYIEEDGSVRVDLNSQEEREKNKRRRVRRPNKRRHRG